jgi:uncharacterized protein
MPHPVTEDERIVSMDVLRGFALLGILIMNVQSFSMIAAAYANPTAYGDLTGANFWVWSLSHVFAAEKFISIFSILFGAGVVLMWQRAQTIGANATRLHYRRAGWMILFGILHAYLFWYGDILYAYGMCALGVYLFRRKSPRFLVTSALILAAIGSLIWIVIGLSIPSAPPEAMNELNSYWKLDQADIDREMEAYRGPWLPQLLYRAGESFFLQTA